MNAEGMYAAAGPELAFERPALRGVLHTIAVVLAALGTAWLLIIASSPTGYVGGAVFGTSLMLLYSTSATYHQLHWRPAWQRGARRADHVMIFVLIAGTYTPFTLDISPGWGIPMLALVWSLAGAGAILKLVWPDAPRWLGVGLYVALGWVAIFAVSEVLAEYTAAPIALVLLGGASYTLGGVLYALRWPNPWPRYFGFHEVFHALVVAGSAVHFAAIAIYVI